MIDPVCLMHGKKLSEHHCLYCCLCFKDLIPDECYEDPQDQKWDICQDCGWQEEIYGMGLMRCP